MASSPSARARAQRAVIIGRAGQRGKDLLAVDDVAALDRARFGAEGNSAGGRRAAFGEGLRVDRAGIEDAPVVHFAALQMRRALRRPACPSRRKSGPTTGSSRHACSRTGPWRRNSGRVRTLRGYRSGSRRRGRHTSFGMQMPSRPSGCMSRKFSIGKVASRSCLAARGASTRLPKRRAFASSSAWRVCQPECIGREQRRVGVDLVDIHHIHSAALRWVTSRGGTASRRKSRTASIEGGGIFQVGKMPEAGQLDSEFGAGDLGGHALHHLRRSIAVELADEAHRRHSYRVRGSHVLRTLRSPRRRPCRSRPAPPPLRQWPSPFLADRALGL